MTQERTEALDASPRLFENDLLDKMSRVHHLTPVIVYTPIILGLSFYSLSDVGLGLLLLGLVMPPLLSAPIMLIALTIIRLIFGATFGWPVLAGFMTGYVIYDCVHYWTHHGQPTSDFGRHVKRLHMLHHFRDAEKGFGVHAIWWDYAFGTAYQKGDTPGSKAV